MELLSCNDGGEVMRLVFTLQSSLTIVIRGVEERRGERLTEVVLAGLGSRVHQHFVLLEQQAPRYLECGLRKNPVDLSGGKII